MLSGLGLFLDPFPTFFVLKDHLQGNMAYDSGTLLKVLTLIISDAAFQYCVSIKMVF
jgi:hypothetical protein